jgi:MATE family multidrug resistance protein
MGTTGLTAQAIGANDNNEIGALLMRTSLIGFVAGLALILLQYPMFWISFKLAPASPEVEILAQSYLQIRVFSAPAAIALLGINGWLIAHERTQAVLILQLWMNGLNILLDLVFVLKLGWGVNGVAFATFIAEWSGLALGIWMARKGFANGVWRNWGQILDRTKLMRMAVVNGNIMVRSFLLQAGFMSFLFLGARFGDVTLAANQVLLQFLYITSYAMDGFVLAAEALIGQAFGAGNRAVFRRSIYLSGLWGLVCVCVMAIAFWLCGNWLIELMTTAPDVRAEALRFLPWMIIGPLAGYACWMLDGVFIGATRTVDMRNMMLVSIVIYVLCLWLLLEPFGNHGLWASLLIFFIARGVTLAWKYPALENSVERV